jgi:hypothetical protein
MKRTIIRSLGLVLTCGVALLGVASCGKKKTTTAARIDANTPQKEGYNILWSDEFSGKKLNEEL